MNIQTWIAVIMVGAGSYLFRYAPVVALHRVSVPPLVERALSYAGASAMTAMLVSALVHHGRTTSVVASVGAVCAVLVAGAVAMRKRSFGLVVLAGLGTYGAALVIETLVAP
jgi:branched-subunit amino acid transport protein